METNVAVSHNSVAKSVCHGKVVTQKLITRSALVNFDLGSVLANSVALEWALQLSFALAALE